MKLSSQKISRWLHSRWLKFLPFGSMLVSLAVLGGVIVFLERYFYETIAAAKVVKVLQNQISLNEVDLPLYQTVVDNLTTKKKFDATAVASVRDPFRPLGVPPTTPATPTKP